MVEMIGLVVGISSSVKFPNMAGHTGFGCIVVTSIMTQCTIVSYVFMRSIERVVLIMHLKFCGLPSCFCGMTINTIFRNSYPLVIRIASSCILCLMTGNTGGRCILKSIGMTINTVNNFMDSC